MLIWMKPSGESLTDLQKSLPKSAKVRQIMSVASTSLSTREQIVSVCNTVSRAHLLRLSEAVCMSAAVLGEIFHCSILAGWSTLLSTGDSSANTSYLILQQVHRYHTL